LTVDIKLKHDLQLQQKLPNKHKLFINQL